MKEIREYLNKRWGNANVESQSVKGRRQKRAATNDVEFLGQHHLDDMYVFPDIKSFVKVLYI